MLQIKPSKKSLACLAAVAVFLLVIGGFAYWDLAGKHGLLSKQITGKEQRLANSEQITRRLFAVEQDYMNAQAKQRGETPPFVVNVQVDGETIARASNNAQQSLAARSFAPLPAY